MRSEFRADIEGLRAVAVTLVVLFHAGVPWLPGGYVGVDVFYVISGFLITSQLLRERLATGTISLSQFYARRIRRLLPAAALVLLATLAMVYLWWPPLARLAIARDAQATAAYLSNVWFAYVQTDYLADTTPSPLLHYWSLAVEEQFYLGWPLLFLLATLGARSPRRRALPVIAVLSALSFTACLWLTQVSQPWAFFSLPTRAWELGVGALLALSTPKLRHLRPGPRSILGWAGVAAVAASGLLLTERTSFPGWAAALPVLGAAAVIAAGVGDEQQAVQRALAVKPAQALGRISYSVYLWHWPLMVVPAVALARPVPPEARAALVALGLGLAWVTYHLVETPIRRQPMLVRRRVTTYAMAGTLTVATIALSLVVSAMPALNVGRPVQAVAADTPISDARIPDFVPSNLTPTLLAVSDDVPIIYKNGCHADQAVTRPKMCIFGDVASRRTVVLFGDSHAAQWFPALEQIARQRGWRLLSLTKSACPSVSVNTWQDNLNRAYRECDVWRTNAMAIINQVRPSLVVISNSSEHEVIGRRSWAQGMRLTLSSLPPGAAKVVVGDTPRFGQDPPTCLSGHLTDPSACALPMATAVDGRIRAVERRVSAASGARYIDASAWICRAGNCPVIIGNLLVFRDRHHLTTPFSFHLAGALDDELGHY